MKNYKGIIAVIALFLMNNALGDEQRVYPKGPSTNYGRFLRGFSRPVITSNNMIEPSWVAGAINALHDDGINVTLTDPDLANELWYAIEGTVQYEQNLPKNVNNPSFRRRIWESLTRTLSGLSSRLAAPTAYNRAPQTNYGRFLIGFSGSVLTPNNDITINWLRGAVEALRKDGYQLNPNDSGLLRELWNAIEPRVNEVTSLPQNRNNQNIRIDVWNSLTRDLNILLRR